MEKCNASKEFAIIYLLLLQIELNWSEDLEIIKEVAGY